MDWNKLRVFHAVARAGSVSEASERLHLSPSAVSRQITALENGLDILLFHRHGRGLILTEQGERLFQTAQEIHHKLTMTQRQLAESKDRPSGPLKVTTTVAFGSTWLTTRIKEFIELYPDVEISLVLWDQEVDLSMREADVAIRMIEPKQPNLIARSLMTVHSGVYASHKYITKHGAPQSAIDLDNHAIITYGDDFPHAVRTVNWLLHEGENPKSPRKPILKVNNLYAMYRAARSGLGLAGLPAFMAPEESPNLQRVLPQLEGPTHRAWFTYPEELRRSKRIVVFRDFLLRKVEEDGF